MPDKDIRSIIAVGDTPPRKRPKMHRSDAASRPSYTYELSTNDINAPVDQKYPEPTFCDLKRKRARKHYVQGQRVPSEKTLKNRLAAAYRSRDYRRAVGIIALWDAIVRGVTEEEKQDFEAKNVSREVQRQESEPRSEPRSDSQRQRPLIRLKLSMRPAERERGNDRAKDNSKQVAGPCI